MYINPIQFGSIGDIGNVAGAGRTQDKERNLQDMSGAGFGNVLKSAWDAAAEGEADVAQKQYLQSIGEIEDTHTLPIAEGKAELALSLMVGLRNKALDAYNELMRMNV